MPLLTDVSAAVPIPTSLVDGNVGGYTRNIGYMASDGTIQGSRTEIRAFNDRGSACVKGGVYVLNYDGDEEECPKVNTCTALTGDLVQKLVVALRATPDQEWDWFALAGHVDALVDGDATDVAKDDTLKITTATNADAFIQDQSGYVLTVDSAAVACEANTSTEALKKVYLLPRTSDVD